MTALLLALLVGRVVPGVRLPKMSRGCFSVVARDILGSLTPGSTRLARAFQTRTPGRKRSNLEFRDRVHFLTCLQPSSIVTIMAPTEAFHDLEFAMLERIEGKIVSSIKTLQKDSIHSGE